MLKAGDKVLVQSAVGEAKNGTVMKVGLFRVSVKYESFRGDTMLAAFYRWSIFLIRRED